MNKSTAKGRKKLRDGSTAIYQVKVNWACWLCMQPERRSYVIAGRWVGRCQRPAGVYCHNGIINHVSMMKRTFNLADTLCGLTWMGMGVTILKLKKKPRYALPAFNPNMWRRPTTIIKHRSDHDDDHHR